jgi:hypothetical protein
MATSHMRHRPRVWQLLAQAHSIGLLCTSDQLVTQGATYTTHNKHKRRTSSEIRFRDRWIQAGAELRVNPHGHRDWFQHSLLL